MKSIFEKYLSNTPKDANQIQIQIFHLVGFQIQIQLERLRSEDTPRRLMITHTI